MSNAKSIYNALLEMPFGALQKFRQAAINEGNSLYEDTARAAYEVDRARSSVKSASLSGRGFDRAFAKLRIAEAQAEVDIFEHTHDHLGVEHAEEVRADFVARLHSAQTQLAQVEALVVAFTAFSSRALEPLQTLAGSATAPEDVT